MRYHAYASTNYLKRNGQPKSVEDLDRHRLIGYSGGAANFLTPSLNSLQGAGRDNRSPRASALTVNNMVGLRTAVESGAGIGVLPDYSVVPELDCYFVYAEELKTVARVQVFRDFLVTNAQRWRF